MRSVQSEQLNMHINQLWIVARALFRVMKEERHSISSFGCITCPTHQRIARAHVKRS
jgi:hypothetical protein